MQDSLDKLRAEAGLAQKPPFSQAPFTTQRIVGHALRLAVDIIKAHGEASAHLDTVASIVAPITRKYPFSVQRIPGDISDYDPSEQAEVANINTTVNGIQLPRHWFKRSVSWKTLLAVLANRYNAGLLFTTMRIRGMQVEPGDGLRFVVAACIGRYNAHQNLYNVAKIYRRHFHSLMQLYENVCDVQTMLLDQGMCYGTVCCASCFKHCKVQRQSWRGETECIWHQLFQATQVPAGIMRHLAIKHGLEQLLMRVATAADDQTPFDISQGEEETLLCSALCLARDTGRSIARRTHEVVATLATVHLTVNLPPVSYLDMLLGLCSTAKIDYDVAPAAIVSLVAESPPCFHRVFEFMNRALGKVKKSRIRTFVISKLAPALVAAGLDEETTRDCRAYAAMRRARANHRAVLLLTAYGPTENNAAIACIAASVERLATQTFKL